MASQTFYDGKYNEKKPATEGISCTVYDNGNWEFFVGTTSVASDFSWQPSKSVSRDRAMLIAEDKFRRYKNGDLKGHSTGMSKFAACDKAEAHIGTDHTWDDCGWFPPTESDLK